MGEVGWRWVSVGGENCMEGWMDEKEREKSSRQIALCYNQRVNLRKEEKEVKKEMPKKGKRKEGEKIDSYRKNKREKERLKNEKVDKRRKEQMRKGKTNKRNLQSSQAENTNLIKSVKWRNDEFVQNLDG